MNVNSTTYSESSNITHLVPYPAPVEIGHLIFAFVSTNSNPIITATGWTVIQNTQSNTGALMWKIADAGDVSASNGAGTFDISLSSSQPLGAIIYIVEENNLQLLYEQNSDSGTTHISPPISKEWEPLETLFFSAITGIGNGSRTVSSYPTGYTETEYISTGTGTSNTALASAFKPPETANSETPENFSINLSSTSTTFTLMIFSPVFSSFEPLFLQKDTETQNMIVEISGEFSNPSFSINGESVNIVDNGEFPRKTVITTPNLSEGVYDIQLEDNGIFIEGSVQYLETKKPKIIKINPSAFILNSVFLLEIKGKNFYNSEVKIDGIDCNNITVIDSNTITCDIPASAIQKNAIIEVINDITLLSDSVFISYMEETQSLQPEPLTEAIINVEPIEKL